MDLTAAIRLKIDRLRHAKTTRFNALSTAIEREVASLTYLNAELFTELEDALEADVLGKNDGVADIGRLKEEGGIIEEEEQEERQINEESLMKEKHSENGPEMYDLEDDKHGYYDHVDGGYYDRSHESFDVNKTIALPALPRQASRTPSISPKTVQKDEISTIPATTDVLATHTEQEPLVSSLRTRAHETQLLLAEKHTSLTLLRSKHDIAMKRLDKLQSDLEKVSQKWEAEERNRIQTESKTALGKRKREDDDTESRKKWKSWGLKGVEWGVLFGIGVVSAVGMNKFQPS
jgi:hypothetical protein